MSFALLLLLSVVATSVAYNSRSSLNFTSIPLIMSPSRQRHAACGVNSGTGRAFIAVAGGLLSDGKPTTRLTLFDTTTREFTDVAPPMRNARDGAAIGSSRGLVAVAGGSDGSAQNISMTGVEGLLDVVEIYNVTARMWLPEKTLAAARSDLVGVSTTNFIAFVGGRTSKPAASAHVDVLDARTLEFFSFNLVESRSFPAAAAIGDKIYVAGGDRGDPAGDSPLRFTVEEIDLVARRSRIVFTDTVGLYKTTGCAAGDFVVFAGGDRYVSANTLVPATERMRSLLRVPDTGNFVTNLFGGGSVLFSWPPAGMGAASVGSLAVYFGGRNSSSSFDFLPARAYAFEFDPVRFKNTSINDEGWIYDSDFKRAPVFNHAVASVSDETATYFAIIGGATGQQPGAITDSFALFEFPVAKYPQLAPVCSASPCTGGARCVAPNVCYATPPPTPLPPGDTGAPTPVSLSVMVDTTAMASVSVTEPPGADNTVIIAVSVVCAIVLFVGVIVVGWLIYRKLRAKHSLNYNDTSMSPYTPEAYPTSMGMNGQDRPGYANRGNYVLSSSTNYASQGYQSASNSQMYPSSGVQSSQMYGGGDSLAYALPSPGVGSNRSLDNDGGSHNYVDRMSHVARLTGANAHIEH